MFSPTARLARQFQSRFRGRRWFFFFFGLPSFLGFRTVASLFVTVVFFFFEKLGERPRGDAKPVSSLELHLTPLLFPHLTLQKADVREVPIAQGECTCRQITSNRRLSYYSLFFSFIFPRRAPPLFPTRIKAPRQKEKMHVRKRANRDTGKQRRDAVSREESVAQNTKRIHPLALEAPIVLPRFRTTTTATQNNVSPV